jgi:hypothetical protein
MHLITVTRASVTAGGSVAERAAAASRGGVEKKGVGAAPGAVAGAVNLPKVRQFLHVGAQGARTQPNTCRGILRCCSSSVISELPDDV